MKVNAFHVITRYVNRFKQFLQSHFETWRQIINLMEQVFWSVKCLNWGFYPVIMFYSIHSHWKGIKTCNFSFTGTIQNTSSFVYIYSCQWTSNGEENETLVY